MNRFKKIFFQESSFFIASPAILWQALFLWLPLCFLLFASFLIVKDSLVYTSFEHYRFMLDWMHLSVIVRSLLLAFFNASFCLVIAYPVAYFLACRLRHGKGLALFFLTLPFWINFLVHVYSWFFLLDQNGLLNRLLLGIGLIKEPFHVMNSIGAVMLVMFHGYLPFMILPLFTILEKLDKRLIEASLDLGATKVYTFFHVILPLSYPGALAGFFLVFVLSFGEFVIPSLLGGGKYLYVGTLISEYFLAIRDTAQGAAFTFVSAFMLALALGFCYLLLKFFVKDRT